MPSNALLYTLVPSIFEQVINQCRAVFKPSWFPYYFLENQKVILQIFWENECTVTSGIGDRYQTFPEKMLHYSVKLLKSWNFLQNVWMPFSAACHMSVILVQKTNFMLNNFSAIRIVSWKLELK